MNIEDIRIYCLSKPGTSEGFPFDEDTLVFKVMNKMFLLTSLSENTRMNVKCDPGRAIELREHNEGEVIPGWHMSKKHWNTVYYNGTLTDTFLKE
jgi:predicted DNA-binding protein (MmcQ/YjbR family)